MGSFGSEDLIERVDELAATLAYQRHVRGESFFDAVGGRTYQEIATELSSHFPAGASKERRLRRRRNRWLLHTTRSGSCGSIVSDVFE